MHRIKVVSKATIGALDILRIRQVSLVGQCHKAEIFGVAGVAGCQTSIWKQPDICHPCVNSEP